MFKSSLDSSPRPTAPGALAHSFPYNSTFHCSWKVHCCLEAAMSPHAPVVYFRKTVSVYIYIHARILIYNTYPFFFFFFFNYLSYSDTIWAQRRPGWSSTLPGDADFQQKGREWITGNWWKGTSEIKNISCEKWDISDLSLAALSWAHPARSNRRLLVVATMTSIEWEWKASTLLVRTIQLGEVALPVKLESKHSNAKTERLTIQFTLWMLNSALSKSVQTAVSCSYLKKIRNKNCKPCTTSECENWCTKTCTCCYFYCPWFNTVAL